MGKLKLLSMLCLLLATCITTSASEIPNDEIWYEASEKLEETTSSSSSGLHTNSFNTSISSHTFYDGRGVIKFDGDVISIGGGAFNGCSNLGAIKLPNSLICIGDYAFYCCYGLKSIEIPNSVVKIGSSAFGFCSGLASVTIPNSVTSIGDLAFYMCTSLPVENDLRYADTYLVEPTKKELTSCTIKEGTKWIGGHSFYKCSKLASISIPNSIEHVGDYAFCGCSSLSSISLPGSIKCIGTCSFGGCTSITSITIPNSATNIGSYAFDSCTNLIHIFLSNSISNIDDFAFKKCTSLKEVTIPSSVRKLGISMFSNCSNLIKIKVSWDRPLSVSGEVFSDFDKKACTLYVPKGTSQMYMSAPVWIDFVNIQEYGAEEDECTIAVKQGEGGCVKNVVELGKTYQYIISPADGWSINSVSFNGTDVTNQLTDGRYTTPVITGNSELNVVFKQGGSGVKDLTNSSVKVLASDGCVTITGNDSNECVSVYSVGGSEVASNSGNCIIQLHSGVYIIKIGEEVFKVAI